jgi:hypothetical protein
MGKSRPSESRLRTLSAVGDGRVRLTGAGWSVSAQRAAGAEARVLSDFRTAGWVAVDRVPTDPYESVPVTLTTDGRAVLAHYWPEWSPRVRA